MGKTYLHIDVGNSATTAQILNVSEGKITVKNRSLAITPPLGAENDRTKGLGPVLEEIRDQTGSKDLSLPKGDIGVTISAGGEPKVACAGVVKGISGESAKRAALSAGATVADLICVDDGREDFQRISDLKRHDICMAVLAGGTDDEILEYGNHQLINIAKTLAQGLPFRRGSQEKVPVVYAASSEGRQEVMQILGDVTEIVWADNVRARLEEEHLESARNAVLGSFTESVQKDPLYAGFWSLGSPVILPSGYATGAGVDRFFQENGQNVLCLSLDGDCIQVFSVMKGVSTRTVTPVTAVDPRRASKWLPSPNQAKAFGNMALNLKLRPWTIPATWDELAVFLAFWKEVVREGIEEHKKSAIELRGIRRQRQIDETFQVRVAGGDTLIKLQEIPTVIVTGILSGVMSDEALLSIVSDGIHPSGVTSVYKDPAGIVKTVGLFEVGPVELKAALKPVGVLVGPGQEKERVGTDWAFSETGSGLAPLPVNPDGVVSLDLENSAGIRIVLEPSRTEDLGQGEGRKVQALIAPGFTRVHLDGRPRMRLRSIEKVMHRDILKWYGDLGVFPQEVLAAWAGGRS